MQLTGTTGVVTKNYAYDAFGVETNQVAVDVNPFRYVGEYFDQETNVYYLRARNYNPATSRMLSEDSFWIVLGNVPTLNQSEIMQSANLYVYCVNNPSCWIDPSGYKIAFGNETETQINEYNRAVKYLKENSSNANALIGRLENAKDKNGIDIIFTIEFFTFESKDTETPGYDYKSKTIWWDPTGGVLMGDWTAVMSAAMTLAHEMGHGAQYLDGEMNAYFKNQTINEYTKVEEANVKKYETPIARQLGEPIRRSYNSHHGMVRMNNSTHYRTTSHGLWMFDRHPMNHNHMPVPGGLTWTSQ